MNVKPRVAQSIADKIGLTDELLKKVARIQKRYRKLYEEEDGLLQPIAMRAMQLPLDELEAVSLLFPPSFYRTELRALVIKRKASERPIGGGEVSADQPTAEDSALKQGAKQS